MQKPESDTTERRCNHVLSLGDYPKQCRKCMLIVPDPMCFLGGDRRKAQTTPVMMQCWCCHQYKPCCYSDLRGWLCKECVDV